MILHCCSDEFRDTCSKSVLKIAALKTLSFFFLQIVNFLFVPPKTYEFAYELQQNFS